MITQHTLKPKPGSKILRRRRGRGDSSGRGSTSSRGAKGQSARSGGKVKPGFEGGQTPLIRRLPKLRGFKNPNRISYQVLNVGDLNVFGDGENIDIIALYEKGLISKKKFPVKLLGDGELQKKLIVKIDACSKKAKEQIEKKGGSLQVPKKNDNINKDA